MVVDHLFSLIIAFDEAEETGSVRVLEKCRRRASEMLHAHKNAQPEKHEYGIASGMMNGREVQHSRRSQTGL